MFGSKAPTEMEAIHHIAERQKARIVDGGRARVRHGRGIAHQRRIVADAAQGLGEIEMPAVERHRVLHGAMVHQIEAGQQTGAGRAAGDAGRHVIAEGDTFAAKSIQVRRLQKCLAPIGAQKMRYEIGSPLVDDNEKYVLCGS